MPANECIHLLSVLSTRKNLRAEVHREGSGAQVYLISMTNPSIELPFCGADREGRSIRPETQASLSVCVATRFASKGTSPFRRPLGST